MQTKVGSNFSQKILCEKGVFGHPRSVPKLRSLKVSGDLEAYLAFHFERENQRNYPGPPIPLVENEVA